MKVLLATLVLNEIEWLPKLVEQHRRWPGLVRWAFVESADAVYAEANPDRVTRAGLSVDGTSEYLSQLSRDDPRMQWIPFGFSRHSDPAQGKVAARQQYLYTADIVQPDVIVVIDADEFYTHDHQAEINRLFAGLESDARNLRLPQRHIWRPPSIAESPLFASEVTGAYWAVPHCRIWRWSHRMRYRNNHNTPETALGRLLGGPYVTAPGPQCIHLGFAATRDSRAAKHKYYQARGEGVTDKRQMYVDCRSAYESWQPGDALPHGAAVIPYNGPMPEVFHAQDRTG